MTAAAVQGWGAQAGGPGRVRPNPGSVNDCPCDLDRVSLRLRLGAPACGMETVEVPSLGGP